MFGIYRTVSVTMLMVAGLLGTMTGSQEVLRGERVDIESPIESKCDFVVSCTECDTLIMQEDVQNGPFVINEPGVYCLGESISANDIAIQVNAGNVVIDLQGHVISEGASAGIAINSGNNVEVRNGRVVNCTIAILCQQATNIRILDMTYVNNFLAMNIDGSHGIDIFNNSMLGQDQSSSGGFIVNDSSGIVVQDCKVAFNNTNGVLIRISSCENVLLDGVNAVQNQLTFGGDTLKLFDVDSVNGLCVRNSNFSSNVCSAGQVQIISVANSHSVTFANSRFSDNSVPSAATATLFEVMALDENSGEVHITNCQFNRNSGSSVSERMTLLHPRSSSTVISGNTFQGNMMAQSNVLNQILFLEAQQNGVIVVDDNIILGNVVSQQGSGGSSATFLPIHSVSGNNTITNNIVMGNDNKNRIIRAISVGEENYVQGNILKANLPFNLATGISFVPNVASGSGIKDNIIAEHAVGINANGATANILPVVGNYVYNNSTSYTGGNYLAIAKPDFATGCWTNTSGIPKSS